MENQMETANKQPKKIFYIHDERDLSIVTEIIRVVKPNKAKPWVVTLGQDDESRSLKQNRLAFLWYGILGGMNKEGRLAQRKEWKLRAGVPILLEDQDFNKFYMAAVSPLGYEQKLDAMEFVPVTSLMTVSQFAEYLETIERESALQGIVLPRPEDLYWQALMKEADRQ
jgi:hypothetical protein